MNGRKFNLATAELRCSDVRKGEKGILEGLTKHFTLNEGGFLGFLKKEKSRSTDTSDLLAAFEALCIRGQYRASTDAIEELVRRKGVDDDLRKVGLARAGQIALIKGLPLDLGPIINELDLSRKDLGSAVSQMRSKRRKKNILLEMETSILQSLLLDRQADHVESASHAANYLRGAMDGFDRSNSYGTEIKGGERSYHLTRCMYHTAEFLLRRGDHTRGINGIDACIRRCRRENYEHLLLWSLVTKGEFDDSDDDAVEALDEAVVLADGLSNQWELARAAYLIGSREVLDTESKERCESGIERMVRSSDTAEKAGDMNGSYHYRLDGALWYLRTRQPEKALQESRKVYRSLKSGADPETEIKALTLILYSHLEEDHKRKAKSLLMDLVMNYPVKQYPATFGILKEAVSSVEWLRKDKDTAELFESEIVYTIDESAVDEIIQRAKEAYPNEFGAMLRGIEHITHIEPVMEGAGNRTSFLFSLYSRFSQRNVEGEGVVHSHPSGSARPSRADLSMFGRFPGINIIIGYPYKQDSMAAYDRLGNRVKLEISRRR